MVRAAVLGLLLVSMALGLQVNPRAHQSRNGNGSGIAELDCADDSVRKFRPETGSEAHAISRPSLERYVRAVGLCHDVDAALILALVRVESGGDPVAISPKGAAGLMQLMPSTARRFGVRDPLDPYQNVLGGVRYLKYLIDRYSGRLPDVIAAYRLGEGRFESRAGQSLHPLTLGYIKRVLTARDEVNLTATAGNARKRPKPEPHGPAGALTGGYGRRSTP